MKFGPLEDDPFEQRVQMRREDSWTDKKTKALLHRSL